MTGSWHAICRAAFSSSVTISFVVAKLATYEFVIIGKVVAFTLYPPHLPQTIPYSFWALTSLGVLPSFGALYAISVRQARAWPLPFFRFRLTADTIGFGYILPAIGRIRDFHPLERALTRHTKNVHVSFPHTLDKFVQRW